jgi:RHS repeat-associated protein
MGSPSGTEEPSKKSRSFCFPLFLVVWLLGAGPAAAQCRGDCDGDGEVTIDELARGVSILLDPALLPLCPELDQDGSGNVEIDELLLAVNNALRGCEAEGTRTPTPTSTPGGPISPTPTRAGAPVLSPVGDRSVVLGTSLVLQLAATDPDGDPLTFSASPLPLPINASLDSRTGRFTFSPAGDQAGALQLTFIVTDGVLTDSETITITVQPPGDVTTLEGIVLTAGSAPLAGVRLVFGTQTQVETFSQNDGRFSFTNLPVAGRQRLLIDGGAVPGVPEGTYATVPEMIEVIAGGSNVLRAPIFLLPLDVASADPVVPDRESVVTSSSVMVGGQMFPAVVMTVPAGAARMEESGETFSGLVHISQIPDASFGPMPLPEDLDLSVYIAIQPFGVEYDPPADLAFPNVEGFPVGAVVDIFGLNHDTGAMEKVGDGLVSADGMVHSGTLNPNGTFTRHGVVRNNSWHGFTPQAPVADDDGGSSPTCPCECNREQIGASSVNPRTGDLSLEHRLVSYRSLETERALRLEYHSSTAYPRPLVSTLVTSGNLTPPPVFMASTVSIGGVTHDRVVFTGPPFCTRNCLFARQGQAVDATLLPTGVYPASILVDCQFPVSRRSRTFTQSVAVVNAGASPFGAGWNLAGLQRIHPSATGELLLTQGDDAALIFSPAERARAEIAASAERDFYSFAGSGGEVVTIRMLRRSNQPDGSSTLNPVLELRTSQGLVIARDDDGGDNFPRGPGRNAQLTAFILPASGVYSIAAGGQSGTRGPYDLILISSGGSTLIADSGPAEIESVVLSPPGDFSTLTLESDGSFRRRMKGGTTFTFDARGRQTAAADRSGNTTLYTYDARDRLLSIQDPVGLTTRFEYAGALLSRVIDPANRVTELVHDAGGNLVRITDPDGTSRSFSYDVRRLLISQTDKRAFVSSYTYDFSGRFVRAARTDGSEIALAANQRAGIVDPAPGVGTEQNPAPLVGLDEIVSRIVNGNGRVTTVEETDALGNPTRIVDPLARVTAIERDVNGLHTAVQRPGTRVELTYDDRGNVRARTMVAAGATARTTSFVYDDRFNQLLRVTDPGGRTTTAHYDDAGDLIRIVNAAGGEQTFTYNDRGQVVTLTDEEGHATSLAYDQRGNLNEVNDMTGTALRLTRDDAGNLVRLEEGAEGPARTVTAYTYDAMNRVTAKRLFNTDRPGAQAEEVFRYDAAGNRIETQYRSGATVRRTFDARGRLETVDDPVFGLQRFSYDRGGNLVESRDAAGSSNRYEYDAANRRTKATDGFGREVRVAYTSANLPASVTDALGRVTSFTYNGFLQLTDVRDPLGQLTRYAYNAAGDLVSRTDRAGRTLTYTYSALRQATRVAGPDYALDVTYDRRGLPLAIADDDSALAFTYDGRRRVVEASTLDVGHGPEVTLTYTFDSQGRRTSVADSEGGLTAYEYEVGNLPRLVGTASGTDVSFTYDAALRLREIMFPNGAVSSYAFDSQGRLGTVAHRDASAEVLNSFAYEYDGLGQISRIIEPERTSEFTYDTVGRLLSGGPASAPESYGYDAAGNRVSSHLSAISSHDGANRVRENALFTYDYDAEGNLIRKTAKADGAVTTFTYDSRGHLTGIALPGGAQVGYRYDGLGRRIEKNVDGAITRYVYDGEDVLLEYDGDNNLIARYTHGTLSDQPLAAARGGTEYYFHADHLGSIRSVTGAGGSAVNRYDYDSFGRLLSATEGIPNPYGFTGRERDAESGLYFFRARYYDPDLGRFVSEDPVSPFATGQFNPYTYAGNNPLGATDPSGLDPNDFNSAANQKAVEQQAYRGAQEAGIHLEGKAKVNVITREGELGPRFELIIRLDENGQPLPTLEEAMETGGPAAHSLLVIELSRSTDFGRVVWEADTHTIDVVRGEIVAVGDCGPSMEEFRELLGDRPLEALNDPMVQEKLLEQRAGDPAAALRQSLERLGVEDGKVKFPTVQSREQSAAGVQP